MLKNKITEIKERLRKKETEREQHKCDTESQRREKQSNRSENNNAVANNGARDTRSKVSVKNKVTGELRQSGIKGSESKGHSNTRKRPKWLNEDELERERQLRKRRKCNICIRFEEENKELVRRKVERILRVELEGRKIRYGRSNKIILYCDNLEEKERLMSQKKRLKNEKIWMDDDETERQREVRAWMRQEADELRQKGYAVKIGYRKLIINQVVWRWSESEGNLMEEQVQRE